jgi:hypothetical protein
MAGIGARLRLVLDFSKNEWADNCTSKLMPDIKSEKQRQAFIRLRSPRDLRPGWGAGDVASYLNGGVEGLGGGVAGISMVGTGEIVVAGLFTSC